MELMQTVEDTFSFFELMGMRKEESETEVTYRYLSLPQKGRVDVLGHIDRFYYVKTNYHILKDVTQHYKMDESYVEFGIVKESRNFFTSDKPDKNPQPLPSGITFMVSRPTGAVGYIYINKETYCHGESVILRHSYCKEHLFPIIHRVWGTDSDEYSIIEMAGCNCLPVCAKIILELENCTYTGLSKQLFLEAKVTEFLAEIANEIEHLENKEVLSFTAYELEAVTKAQNILKQHIKQPPSIQTLSRDLGLNPNKMQAAFKYYSGVTVMEYLRSYRMGKALELLKGDMLLAEIALEVGYKSASRFSEAFCKSYGLLPSKYRKLI